MSHANCIQSNTFALSSLKCIYYTILPLNVKILDKSVFCLVVISKHKSLIVFGFTQNVFELPMVASLAIEASDLGQRDSISDIAMPDDSEEVRGSDILLLYLTIFYWWHIIGADSSILKCFVCT